MGHEPPEHQPSGGSGSSDDTGDIHRLADAEIAVTDAALGLPPELLDQVRREIVAGINYYRQFLEVVRQEFHNPEPTDSEEEVGQELTGAWN